MTPEKINAIEFVDNFKFEKESRNYNWCYSEEEVYKLVEEYGKQQWNGAIKLAAENATLEKYNSGIDHNVPNLRINKQSILKLLK